MTPNKLKDEEYKKSFIDFCLANDIIKFGEFTLKSGRKSPYFFNAGLFNTGAKLAELGKFYAAAIQHAEFEYDLLFGPAYKGIPLVATTAIALAEIYQIDKPFCFNRKISKTHGEEGTIVGAPLQGRVLLVDDVLTAGTAISEAIELIKSYPAQLISVCVALDRQEKGQTDLSAIAEIEKNYQLKATSIINLKDLFAYLKFNKEFSIYFSKIKDYIEKYGDERLKKELKL